MSNQSSTQAKYLLRANFTKSMAAMNASHYLMGIGDRHDGNTLVSNHGLLVGIDFGMAFGKGTWAQPLPELVPFRLTKQMLGVLSPLDSAALLKRSMTCVLSEAPPMLTRAPNKASGRSDGPRVTASDRARAEGRQAIPRYVPGTLLNQCRLHKTKKHTHTRQRWTRDCGGKG
jgi:hypothetical protein